MKKHIYLFAIILATAFFNMPSAKAETPNNCFGGTPYQAPGCGSPGQPTNVNSLPQNTTSAHLPINNGVIFLFLSGITIGVITLNKIKTLSPVMAA